MQAAGCDHEVVFDGMCAICGAHVATEAAARVPELGWGMTTHGLMVAQKVMM